MFGPSPETSITRRKPLKAFPSNKAGAASNMPEIEVRIVEVPQPRSPYGIKGVGEIGLVPTAPAVAAALREVDGDWRTVLPMKPAE